MQFNSCCILIQPCDLVVNELMTKADELAREKHHDAVNVQRKVSSVEKRWQRFLTNLEEYRGLLEAAVEFYQLYEQVRQSFFARSCSIVDVL